MEEIAALLFKRGLFLQATLHLFSTTGDKDLLTSLRDMGKTDFFTKEIDEGLLAKTFDIAIHSAKDLPDPLPQGLSLVGMTESIDPRDSLVIRPGYTLKPNPIVGVSSERRETAVRQVWRDAVFRDIRGTIPGRLSLLDSGEYDAIVIAEAALIRLGLTERRRLFLPGETAQNQGRLALVSRSEDVEKFSSLFQCTDEVVV